jgi:Protein of unknown function (DUF2490)
MAAKSALLLSLLAVSLSVVCPRAAGQSAPEMTENEAWPEADLHLQLGSQWRLLSFVGLEQAAGYPYQQWYVASGIGRQLKPISKYHWKNIDPDKEHYLVVGVAYEYLRTNQSASVRNENRVTLDATANFRLASKLLLRDRNWTELRWINGVYSTTYRNLIAAEVNLRVHDFRFTPFVTTEFFYDSPKHAWDQTWYTGGVQLPYKRVFMAEAYYRRESCSTCAPQNWNVGGITLNFYPNNTKE